MLRSTHNLVSLPESHAGLLERGYTIRPFAEPSLLGEVVAACHSVFDRFGLPGDLPSYHERVTVARFTRSSRRDRCFARQFGPRATLPPSSNSSYVAGPDVLMQSRSAFARWSCRRGSRWLTPRFLLRASVPPISGSPRTTPGFGGLLPGRTHREPSLVSAITNSETPFRSSEEIDGPAGLLAPIRHYGTITPPAQAGRPAPPTTWCSSAAWFTGVLLAGRNTWTVDFSTPNDGSEVNIGLLRDSARGSEPESSGVQPGGCRAGTSEPIVAAEARVVLPSVGPFRRGWQSDSTAVRLPAAGCGGSALISGRYRGGSARRMVDENTPARVGPCAGRIRSAPSSTMSSSLQSPGCRHPADAACFSSCVWRLSNDLM